METHLSNATYFARFGVALALGIAIGLEREWRQRGIGVSTTAMVGGGAALYAMVAPLIAVTGADPTRIAAQVVTGIGFIGAGVILREGGSVRGLTTAATLWATAAVGLLAGFGLLPEAAGAGACILAANVVLYPLNRGIAKIKRRTRGIHVNYTLSVTCAAASQDDVRENILRFSERPMLDLKALDTSSEGNGALTMRARFSRRGRDDRAVDTLEKSIQRLPGVSAASWQASAEFL